MHLILCVDERMGMSFCNRRLSSDRLLRADMLALTEGRLLWMSPYSKGQFTEEAPNIRADAAYLRLAGEGEYCFCENALPQENIESIILYRWNRHYPADLYFSEALLEDRLCVQVAEFSGFSHEIITREVYAL